MKKLLILLVFVTSIAQAQYTITGTMTPPERSDWVVLQKLEGAKQKFLTHTTIKIVSIEIDGKKENVGRFQFTLPKDAKSGMYRATYRNGGAGFVDFLFNKEDIEMAFNPQHPEQSVVFTKSLENKLYYEYQEALALTQEKLDIVQFSYFKNKDKKSEKAYKKALKKVKEVQGIYEDKTKGMLANHFVKASKNYNSPVIIEDSKDYLEGLSTNFFKNIDFTSKELYNSSFLINKVADYIFFLKEGETPEIQNDMYLKTIPEVMKVVKGNSIFKQQVIEYLITTFTNGKNAKIVDWLFAQYYDKLPFEVKKPDFRRKKLNLLKTAIGRYAPNFSWKEEGKNYSLSTLKDGENYLLIFWSTRCSHCVTEIPELYKFIKNHKKTSVVAFAIEDDEFDFNEFTKQLYGWHNVLGTHPENRFKNKTVKEYLIDATPTYFVLDKNKKIIARPNTIKDVKKYFNTLKKKEEKKQNLKKKK